MGCENCKSRAARSGLYENSLKVSIEDDDVYSLKESLSLCACVNSLKPSALVSQKEIFVGSYRFTLLGYSLWCGSGKCYQYLKRRQSASVLQMEANFTSQNLNPLYYLCEKGYLSVLKHYFPEYISSHTGKALNTNTYKPLSTPPMPAIQVACSKGHLNIIKYLTGFFESINPIPELDIHNINPLTGENCALVAVRAGDFPMIKMLYEMYRADFHFVNANGEGAYQILTKASNENFSLIFLSCLSYLMDVIKVDVLFKCHETLRLMENNLLANLFERRLREKGINTAETESGGFCGRSLLEKMSPLQSTHLALSCASEANLQPSPVLIGGFSPILN